jgi:peptidoglycan/xylan/chitin deacetylase (PgdA/CDA1 family)
MHKCRTRVGTRRIPLAVLTTAALLAVLLAPAKAAPGVDPSLARSDPLLWYLKHCRRITVRPREECYWLRPDPEHRQPASEVDQTGYIKGLYLPRAGVGSPSLRDRVKTLIETTELNAVVIDVKGDFGFLVYPSEVEMVQEIGADRKTVMTDETWTQFIEWFHDREVYTIARIVAFKDEPLAVAHPEWAVTDSATGGLWRDGEALAWADPSHEEVHDYNIALAVEAAQMGFDEIQFDYVRFPSDGRISRATFAQPNTQENRVQTIASFLDKAEQALEPHNTKLAADIFGYVAWMAGDLGIGQQVEALSPHLDVLSPMLYPSSFGMGLPGLDSRYRDAIAYPYEVVYEPTRLALERARAVNPDIEIRPWLQDFRDYAFDGRRYTPDEMRLQMDGAREAGARGWMLWDPAVGYTAEALVSARALHTPNTSGRVLILEYHRIGEPEGRWQRTPVNFRADLELLLAGGYYPVNLRDLVDNQLRSVPAGKRPVVLTFDDSSISQFRTLPDGTVDPDSAVGILREFHEAHPADWPLRATFFVLPGEGQPGHALFGQPELALKKLSQLVEWGMEIGSHTISHANLYQATAEKVQRELGLSQARLEDWLPGYDVVSLSVPYGIYPQDEALLAAGEHDGVPYSYAAAVQVGAGLAYSPHTASFDPYHIPRVQAIQPELDRWLGIADQPSISYVSAGE